MMRKRLFRRGVCHLRFIKGAARSLPMCFATSSACFVFLFLHLTRRDEHAPLPVRPSALGSQGRIVKLITKLKESQIES